MFRYFKELIADIKHRRAIGHCLIHSWSKWETQSVGWQPVIGGKEEFVLKRKECRDCHTMRSKKKILSFSPE
jgi:hypothetical protein